MPEPMSDKHYESKFEFPLFKLIKQRAEEKDISYRDAAIEVVPEYMKNIRYDDTEFENEVMDKAEEESKVEIESWQKMMQHSGNGD